MIRPRTVSIALVAISIAAAVNCSDHKPGGASAEAGKMWTPSEAGLTLHVPRAEISAVIATLMAKKPPTPLVQRTWVHAQRLYRNYKNAPLWLIGDGLDKPRVGALMLAVADVASDGLRVEDYPIAALRAAIDTLSASTDPTPVQLANVDVMLTAAYVTLGQDLMTGQIDPHAVNQSWHITPSAERLDSALFRSIRADLLGDAIALMRPRDEGYDSLRVQLARYRVAVKRGWTHVPEGKSLVVGKTDSRARIRALKARLAEEGYVGDSAVAPNVATKPRGMNANPTGPTATYTRPIAAGVARFQAHHGIVVDSSLGPETIDAMNVPPYYRAAQIAANLERFRWMPRALGERYIMVNVPAFKVVAYDSGKQVLEMKVIVGEEYEGKATPVFADTMKTVVFRPYWNIPPSIQTAEFEPKIAADKTFQKRGGYEYFKDAGITRLRQKPGPTNALGLVKFLFPNDFNIYLHDTPNGELFKKDVRAFSHGCIRLERPDEMAEFVLGWDLDKVHAAMRSGPDNTAVPVSHPIPVFITYFTAYVTDGELYFGNDLYKRDGSLADLMVPGALPSDDALQAMQSLRELAQSWGVS